MGGPHGCPHGCPHNTREPVGGGMCQLDLGKKAQKSALEETERKATKKIRECMNAKLPATIALTAKKSFGNVKKSHFKKMQIFY